MNSKWLRSLCAVWMVGVGLSGCGSTQSTDEEVEREVVGKPPSKTDDPYYVMNMPEEAETAESSGYIGAAENGRGADTESGSATVGTSESDGDTDTRHDPESESDAVSKAEPEDGAADSEPVRVSKAEPPDNKRREKRDEMSEGRGVQCHSCIRICPLTDRGGDPDCSAGERDVICGWGMHSEKKSARELAAAECNGALEMAREMKQWSRIEGECPPPTCRSGRSGR